MDYMKSEEGQRLSTWGIEGVHYNIGSDRYPTRTQAGRDAMSSDGYKNICIGVWTFGMSAKTEGLWNYDPSRPEITNALLAWKKVQQFNPEYYFLKPSSDSDEKAIYTKVMALIEKERIKIIATKSDAEFDAAYSNFIKSAESLGLKKLESSMTDKYNNEVKKKYVK